MTVCRAVLSDTACAVKFSVDIPPCGHRDSALLNTRSVRGSLAHRACVRGLGERGGERRSAE